MAETVKDPSTEANPTRSDPSRVASPRDEALDEVRAVRAANEERTRRHSSVEVIASIAASSMSGSDNVKPVDLHAIDGQLHLNSHGEKVLNRDQIVELQQKLAAAFQAVS